MNLRMRQICLVAHDLDKVAEDFREIFGLEVCYVDPAVGKYGLRNFLMPIGNNFLEVVSPTREGTAGGRYLERRGGDGGYMVITQVADVKARRQHMAEVGVRIVNELKSDESEGIQLHPRDTGGAILSFDYNDGWEDPAGPWHPAGHDWKPAVRTERVTAMTAAELQSDDPERLATRWGEILQRPVVRDARARPSIQLDDAVLRFVPAADGRGEGLGGLDLATRDSTRVMQAAAARGCERLDDDTILVCGTRFRLVPAAS